MADLNALIAQGYQFQPLPDPFAQYAKRQQLDLGEQTNQLNQMKMQEAQAAGLERNALRQFLPGLNEGNRNQLLGYGATGQSIFKTMAEGDKERRLAEQAVSQTAVNKSNILKNAVAQTRDAVAGIDPNDAPSYMTLRTSVLSQYPDLEPYMPSAWNADVKQRLIVTAASVLEGQKPEPGFTLSPGQVRYPAGYTGVVTAPTAATKPPEKLEIMGALGYSMDAAGDAAYEAAKRAPPTVAAPPAEISTMNALGIPVTPEGYAYLQQLKTKPVVTAEPTTNEIKNARAIALGAGPEGSAAYNQSLQTQLLRLTDKPVTAAAAATSTEMKNADAFALLKGPAGSPAYNQEFAKQLARLTAKSEGAAKDDPNTTVASTQVDNAGNVTFYNKFGKPINTQKGAGKPSATFEKTAAAKVNLARDLDQAIAELTAVTKDGGLIDQSTGSGVGRAVDIGARFIGKAMPGDIAIGKLQPVADLALKMVPRFEGPQSNADTTSYKQAAGQLADPTLPPEIRKAAGKTVLRLMIARKGQFTTADIPTEGAGAAPTGVDTRNPLLN